MRKRIIVVAAIGVGLLAGAAGLLSYSASAPLPLAVWVRVPNEGELIAADVRYSPNGEQIVRLVFSPDLDANDRPRAAPAEIHLISSRGALSDVVEDLGLTHGARYTRVDRDIVSVGDSRWWRYARVQME